MWGVCGLLIRVHNPIDDMKKKLSHYVSRFYLKAWAENNLIWCLYEGKIIHPNLRNVAAENYFYKLEDLSSEDASFVRGILINDSPVLLKPIHEKLLNIFCMPHKAKRILESRNVVSEKTWDVETSETMSVIEQLITNMNEDIHTSIEESFEPYIRAMLGGDLAFYFDPVHAAIFFRGIAVQYLRTNQIKNGMAILGPERFGIFQRVQNVVVHIMAVNLGFSLYRMRDRYKIMLLDSHSNTPLITADQPIINIAANPRDRRPPEKFDLYYPLSPSKAMLLIESEINFPQQIDAEAARQYNLRMIAHSHKQIFSNSREYLELIKAM